MSLALTLGRFPGVAPTPSIRRALLHLRLAARLTRFFARPDPRPAAPRPAGIDLLEPRLAYSFTYWSSIGPAIAKVPSTIGPIASTSVINFNVTVYTGPLNVKNTLDRIRANNGPDRSNDGAVFNNSTGQLPTGHGTWYEFTVEPSGGTNINFSLSPYNVAFPGPMRILLATDGDTFFTGDHYVTFQNIYDPSVTGTPTITAFTAAPASVTAGTPTTLTASGVSEVGGSGSITSVLFYRESNGTSGLQTASDTLLGSGTQSGTSWSISAATSSLSAGTYTVYAVANDSNGKSSAVSSTSFNVLSAAPTFTSSVINAGAAQRSRVYSITLNFSSPVTLPTSALALTSGGTPFAGTLAVSPASGYASSYTVSFSGSTVVNGSVPDGRYTLTLSAALITNSSSQSLAGGNQTVSFFRLYGDSNGDAAVDATDLAAFNTTYGLSLGAPAYLSYFDYDGNNAINNTDLLNFRKRYGTSLPAAALLPAAAPLPAPTLISAPVASPTPTPTHKPIKHHHRH